VSLTAASLSNAFIIA